MKTENTVKTVITVLALVLSACNSDSGSGAPGAPDGNVTLAVSTVTPTPSPTVTPSPSPSPSPSPTPYAFSGGAGTLPNPYHLVNAQDVNHIRDFPAGYFQMMQTIDMSSLSNFTPIPAFSGVIYGQTYALSNLTITTSGSATAAFVITLSGTIVQLEMANFKSSSQAGFASGFAGTLTSTAMLSADRLYGTITSPLGGNGYNMGTGTPFYVSKAAGANVTVSTSDLDVMFNGNRVNNPDHL